MRLKQLAHIPRALRRMRDAAQSGGKPVSVQLADVRRLRTLGAGVGLDDYFDLRLFEPQVTREELPNYLGERRNYRLAQVFNDPQYWVFAQDKLLFDRWARSYGLPVPAVRALLGGTLIPGEQAIDRICSISELREWLSQAQCMPLFLKPVSGSFGAKNLVLNDFVAQEDRLQLSDGTWHDLPEFWERLWVKQDFMDPRRGYLLQECVTQCAELVDVVGRSLSTVRLVSLITGGEVRVIAGEWKIATGGKPSDNFDRGRLGNLLAGIDMASGRTTRVSDGYGRPLHNTFAHPDTGAELCGRALPHWEEAIALVEHATRAVPMFRMQHWDVAFSQEGPMLIELNAVGGPHVLQYINGGGFLTEQVREAALEAAQEAGGQVRLPAWLKPRHGKGVC